MGGEMRRLRRERRTVRAMVELYCAHHHGGDGPCAGCATLASYADYRLDRCPFGTDKPPCAECAVHCYRAAEREAMREVMRFSGPRMLLRHPLLAVLHVLDGRRKGRSRAGSGHDRRAPLSARAER